MRITGYTSRLTRTQKFAASGVAAAAGVTALAVGAAPASADNGSAGQSLAKPASVESVNAAVKAKAPTGDHAEGKTPSGGIIQTVAKSQGAEKQSPIQLGETDQGRQIQALNSQQSQAQKEQKAQQEKKAADARADKAASRSAERPKYADNLDGWIKEARDIMKQHGIPGSYDGIKKNVIRESGGDPNASNDWDVNAQNGVPSKGLLQTIQPTFDAYHVKGTEKKINDPVANIVAACNYAADKYGSMDNVDSAY